MDYVEVYKEEIKIYMRIKEAYINMNEDDIRGAYNLMKESLIAYERWSKIRYDIRLQSSRGKDAELKDRLEEMCKFLREVNQECRMCWSNSKNDYNNLKSI